MCTSALRAGPALSALLALSWSAPGLAQALPRAERPVPKVGDSTVYRDLTVRTGEKRDTTFVVIAVDAERIVSETGGSTSGTRTFNRDFNPVETKTGEVVTFIAKPFWAYLQFPLEVGRKWDIPFEAEVKGRPADRHAKWQWKARVTAAEAVTVPAGTFQAFKIEYDGSFATRQGNQSWTGTQKETVWFAPELGRIVKRDYEQAAPSRNFLEHHVIELLSFKAAP
jgi:hypothetical protein